MANVLTRPSEPVTESVARIVIDDDEVCATFPEKREDFRMAVKRLGYYWERPCWVLTVADADKRPHAAAELCHTLLAAGYCVSVDEQIRDMAIGGNYTPLARRFVRVYTSDDYYNGWFAIIWQWPDDLYSAARRLPGSCYRKPYVIVPQEYYAEVLDFADIHNFEVSAAAQKLAAAAQQEREAALVVSLESPQERTAVDGKFPTLEIPDDLDIDDELADDAA